MLFIWNKDKGNPNMTKSIRRRTFIKNVIVVIALSIGVGKFTHNLFSNQAYASSANENTISLDKIERLMNRGSVEKILKEEYDSGLIQRVEYNKRKRKTNFDELVYQKHLDSENRKPVLVFFYDDEFKKKIANLDYEKREAIILKELARKYQNRIRFVTYESDVDPKLAKSKHKGITTNYGIKATPSIAMYCTFNFIKGETSDNNNGMIKQTDILRGGPNKDKLIESWLEFIRYKWIPTNITSPNNVFSWRFNNSGNEKKVAYQP